MAERFSYLLSPFSRYMLGDLACSRSILLSVKVIFQSCKNVFYLKGYDSLGCWNLPENDTSKVMSLEGHHSGLEGLYWDR